MIYFDIDGVTRDLCSIVFPNDPFVDWDQQNDQGEGFVDIVNKNPSLCKISPPTEYLHVIKSVSIPHFLTIQPPSWRKYTIEWLDYHVGRYDVQFLDHTENKLNFLQPRDLLVEDYPLFGDYSQVILIDRLYNRNVICARRVKTPIQLLDAIGGRAYE
jgi:hypothetical protein